MIRSQIYLTEDESNSLKAIADETGRTQSDLIREAIDSLISTEKKITVKRGKRLLEYGKIDATNPM